MLQATLERLPGICAAVVFLTLELVPTRVSHANSLPLFRTNLTLPEASRGSIPANKGVFPKTTPTSPIVRSITVEQKVPDSSNTVALFI